MVEVPLCSVETVNCWTDKGNAIQFRSRLRLICGSVHDVDFEELFRWNSNKKNSARIYLGWNQFDLFDDHHFDQKLECESEDGPCTFPKESSLEDQLGSD